MKDDKETCLSFFGIGPMTNETRRKTPTTSISRRPSFSSSSMYLLVLKLMIFIVPTLILSSFAVGASSCNQLDKDSLLSFSLNISTSFSYTGLNWSSSIDCCLWEGVLCDEDEGHGDRRVIHLSLPHRGLCGSISPSLINLTHLSHLNLSHNQFSGTLPTQFFSLLNHLQILDLSYNHFSGKLPLFDTDNSSTSNSSITQVLDLSSNIFHGPIPSSLYQHLAAAAAGGTLTTFNVSNNTFTGHIPTSVFCINDNNSSFRILDLSYNHFNGSITPGLGECSKLEIFRAGFNSLSGPFPSDIFRAVTLQEISLPLNNISGTIGNEIAGLINLTVLELYSNILSGTIPEDIGKLSKLERLLIHVNNLTGTLPPSLTNCTNLVMLNLRVNSLRGDLSAFNFSMLLRLTTLDLGNNNFTGSLPPSLYACKSLAAVRLASNQLGGQILPDILALQSLSFLSLSTNNLTNITGAIRILMGLKNLRTLALSQNFFGEALPDDENMIDPDGFQYLQILALGACKLLGQVPAWLAKLKKLEVLDLSFNNIIGPIPSWLGTLPQLFYIDLSNNLITGIFPTELTGLPALTSQQANDEVEQTYLELPVFVMPANATQQQYNQLSNIPPAIYLKCNKLHGSIPVEVGQLKFLHVLDLSCNNFSGRIPDQISHLTNLERLDLSKNHLSGEIPVSLKDLCFVSYFSVANNDLQGPIPTGGQFDTFSNFSFSENPRLCGSAVQRSCRNSQGGDATHSSSNRKLIVGVAIVVCIGIAFIVTMLALWILSKRRIIPGGDTDKVELESISTNTNTGAHNEVDKDASVVVLFPNKMNEIKDLTIFEILKATENFSQANIIGCGGFGLVYKATLANGTNVAVKKLSGDLGLMEREFKAEVEALSTAQHENLVALQGYCIHEGFRLLIYTYMENGSLDYWLHEKAEGASQLDWPTRLKIAQGASCGLAYMHQICEPHIVHRDIKSSNILLNEKFEARVADFGLSRLILPYQTHVTTELVGTLGYIPPEYGQAWVATFRGDVYSFGVVMLELLTGKRPVEVCRPKMSRELVGWVQQMRSECKQDQVFDPHLRGKGYEDEMLQVLDVACMCVNLNPFKRPTITEVVEWLKNVGAANQQQNK
ncbi:Receptor kinase [Quillaja saponaria]|uniref:non-specific serine/threonine protein kinase n=1 Tax=Quillaja saponaria TaxID=32244 RepID=A0AAD7LSJ3_QUISA|nr:Receptor kinase [Quillaja saponaria]